MVPIIGQSKVSNSREYVKSLIDFFTIIINHVKKIASSFENKF